jgi:hypothetical protein
MQGITMIQSMGQCTPKPGATFRNTQDKRFLTRAQWLADNKDALNLRYVLHGGDVVNWGEWDPWQYDVADEGMQVLENAGIPYILSVGNHDTRAVGAPGPDNVPVSEITGGGSACNPATVKQDVRKNPLFNQYFSGRFGESAGSYTAYCAAGDANPACSISNGYTVFDAGGVKWLVLSLELWPRAEVVAWAESIVKNHLNYNVIVVTHSYLINSNGSLHGDNGGYGATAPAYLRDNLVIKYPNIRFVFSGHEGTVASYKDAGNPTVAYLQNMNDNGLVRILRVDTANNTATSYLYATQTGKYWNGAAWVTATPGAVQEVKTGMSYIH